MSSHSIAEARDRLPELVALARRGETVVLTENGAPVAELRPVAEHRPPRGPVDAAALEWLDRLRVRPARPLSIDGATLIRQLRDEGP